jgi:hypothetical protein
MTPTTPIAPTIPSTFVFNDWNLDLRAELYKEEFFRTSAWMTARDGWVAHWTGSTRAELAELRGSRMAERSKHIGEIVSEHQSDVLIGYWNDKLKFGPTTHWFTSELVHASLHLAGSVAMYFKDRFRRVRPWVLAPQLSPPILPLPGHPAYPGGHSTQMYLMARILEDLSGEKDLMTVAREVAVNRERAGLNYPSDTQAGRHLADRMFDVLTTKCELFRLTLERAKDEWRRPASTMDLFVKNLPHQ